MREHEICFAQRINCRAVVAASGWNYMGRGFWEQWLCGDFTQSGNPHAISYAINRNTEEYKISGQNPDM